MTAEEGVAPPRAIASSVALVVATAGVAIGRIGGSATALTVAEVAILVYALLEAPRLHRGARIMAGAALASGALTAFAAGAGPVLLAALDRVAFFAALLTGLAFLREAGLTSPLLSRVGTSLVSQAPGLRYAVVSVGSHLASIVLNFGVMPLLGSAFQRDGSAAGGGCPRVRRRMNLALLRGFAAMTMWSPLSLSFAVTIASIRSVEWEHLVPLGMMMAALFMVFGWVLDRATGRDEGASPPTVVAGRLSPLRDLLFLVSGVMLTVIVASYGLATSLLDAVIVCSPVLGIAWLVVQSWDGGAMGAVGAAFRRLRARSPVMLPSYRNEIVILGGASFIGTVIAAFVPVGAVQDALVPLSLPPGVLVVLLAWTIIVAGQFGLGPLIVVTVLGAAIPDPAVYGVHPLLLGCAFMGGWGLAVGSAPVAAGILTLSNMAGVRASTIGRQWNGPYTVLGAVLLAGWLVLLDLVLA